MTADQRERAAIDCSAEGCDRHARKRGMCGMHYERLRKQGLKPLEKPSPAERLTAGLKRMPNGCLEWTKGTDDDGYGRIQVDGKKIGTHRFAWTLANGPIPDGFHVLHHCDNPPCCDAEKCLFLGTNVDNITDRDAKKRGSHHTNGNEKNTHCPHGHPFDLTNTYLAPSGQRVCRTCQRTAAARYRATRAIRTLVSA